MLPPRGGTMPPAGAAARHDSNDSGGDSRADALARRVSPLGDYHGRRGKTADLTG
jgi:hypothetical protein